MNLPHRQAASPGGDNRAGGDGIGTVANPPAQPLVVGSVGFGPAWTVEDSMAASIIRLEQELEEANARIAVLEEQARILVAERDEAREERDRSRMETVEAAKYRQHNDPDQGRRANDSRTL